MSGFALAQGPAEPAEYHSLSRRMCTCAWWHYAQPAVVNREGECDSLAYAARLKCTRSNVCTVLRTVSVQVHRLYWAATFLLYIPIVDAQAHAPSRSQSTFDKIQENKIKLRSLFCSRPAGQPYRYTSTVWIALYNMPSTMRLALKAIIPPFEGVWIYRSSVSAPQLGLGSVGERQEPHPPPSTAAMPAPTKVSKPGKDN